MTIIDPTIVSAFLLVLVVACLATAVALGMAVRQYVDSRPGLTPRVRSGVAIRHGRLAH